MSLKKGGLRNISTGVSVIPDSAIAHYDAQSLTGLSDGDPVTTWPDELGQRDLIEGQAPTYRDPGINGNPAVEFSEDDFLRGEDHFDFGREASIIFVMDSPIVYIENHILSFRNDTGQGSIFRFEDDQADVWTRTDDGTTENPGWNPGDGTTLNSYIVEDNSSMDLTVRINKDEHSTETHGGDGFSGNKLGVTADFDGSHRCGATIGEILVLDEGSPSDVIVQEDRMWTRWDIG